MFLLLEYVMTYLSDTRTREGERKYFDFIRLDWQMWLKLSRPMNFRTLFKKKIKLMTLLFKRYVQLWGGENGKLFNG